MNMKEIVTDMVYGIVLVGLIFGTIFGATYAMESMNMAKDSIRIAIATPLFLYFCWAFGGLTRSMLNRS